jgi:hypothetical protein
LTGLALIHGYTVAFWVSAAILAGGALVAVILFRTGPLTGPGRRPQPGALENAARTRTSADDATPAPARPAAG